MTKVISSWCQICNDEQANKTEDNAMKQFAGIHETTQAATTVSRQAEELQRLVQQFRL
jgi:methyl-accepting chemotaxis protein